MSIRVGSSGDRTLRPKKRSAALSPFTRGAHSVCQLHIVGHRSDGAFLQHLEECLFSYRHLIFRETVRRRVKRTRTLADNAQFFALGLPLVAKLFAAIVPDVTGGTL